MSQSDDNSQKDRNTDFEKDIRTDNDVNDLLKGKEKETSYSQIFDSVNEYPEVVALSFAIVGIILLGILSQNQIGAFEPKEIKLVEMENFKEVKVHVEAIVTDAYNPSSDFWIVDITDESIEYSTLLFASSLNFIPKTGDTLDIVGEVAEYEGKLEIMSDADDVVLLSRGEGELVTVSDLANDPAYYAGKIVTVQTYVKTTPTTAYNTTSLTIGGTYNNLRIETENSDLVDVIIKGDFVEVTGLIKFDRYWFSYEISLDDETHGVRLIND